MKNKIFLMLLISVLLIGIIFPAEEGDEIDIVGENFENIGSLIGEGLEILAKGGVRISKEEGISTLEFYGEEASLNIEGNIYENIDTNSDNPAYIKLNELGEVLSADLPASDKTVFSFGKDEFGTEKIFGLFKGQRVKYENGIANVIGKKGDFFGYGEKGSNIFTEIGFLGESINVERVSETSSLFTGEFNLGEDEIYGNSVIEDGGKILQIKSGTNALIGKIKHQASRDLNFYYDENFDIGEHESENYFNYGKDKISFGGIGYTSDLGEENNIFGNMKTQIQEGYSTKTRNLKITMNGGNIEISKYIDSETSDLGFNIRHKGDFIIENGRAFVYSEKSLDLKEQRIFVKYYYDEEGLLDCYDLNLNQGGYTLKDRIFTDTQENVIVNMNTPWENAILNAKNLNDEELEEIKKAIENSRGARPREYSYLIDENKHEELVKGFYDAVETANQNKYGVEISPEELWTRVMLEGGAKYEEGYLVYDYDHLGPNADVFGSRLGLDYITSQKKELEEGGFLPKGFLDKFSRENSPESEIDLPMNTLVFDNTANVLTAFAGELARRKYHFEQDFISAFGEEEFKKTSDEEKYFWLTYYFNYGEAGGKGELTGTTYQRYDPNQWKYITVQGKGRKNIYQAWTGPEPGSAGSNIGTGRSPRFNSLLAEATYILVKFAKIFSLP